jgi:hypothetical protein
VIFSWANPEVVEGDHVLEDKAPYLNVTGFILRAVLFFLIWIVFARLFVNKSLRQDEGEGGVAATLTMRKLSPPFIILFAFTLTFAAFDWLMSLEPHWFSTIFGVYVFSGVTLASLAAITIGVVWMRANGVIERNLVTHHHLYSLGALLFAFTCFWGYIAFSQYMLIWYANIPEETVFFIERSEHGWGAVSVWLALLRFVIPFFLLLSCTAKTFGPALVGVSIVVLAGQLLDLYWIIMPQIHAAAPHLEASDLGPRFEAAELGPPLVLIGILFLYVAFFMRRHRAVAVGDPLFEKSRPFHL